MVRFKSSRFPACRHGTKRKVTDWVRILIKNSQSRQILFLEHEYHLAFDSAVSVGLGLEEEQEKHGSNRQHREKPEGVSYTLPEEIPMTC